MKGYRLIGIPLVMALSLDCVGEGVDTAPESMSNCRYSSDRDFASAGYRIFHRLPAECPVPVIARVPYFSLSQQYSATIRGPLYDADEVRTTIFNDAFQVVARFTGFFQPEGGFDRANVGGQYQAGTVPVTINEIRTDHAVNSIFPENGQAIVFLDYEGTAVVIYASMTVEEGEVFTLTANVESEQFIAPYTYQWFQDGNEVQAPSSSSTYTGAIFGSGRTVAFRVEVTDATGQTAMARHRIDVPARCPDPPCAAQ